jgi:hypothetical protein
LASLRRARRATPGATVPYTLTVLNNLGWDETFTVTYSARVDDERTCRVGPIPDGSEDFVVNVTVPSDANCYAPDLAAGTAIAQSSPIISDTAYLDTSASPPGVGDLSGTVFDANTGAGIADAHVQLYLAIPDEYKHAWTLADGSYEFAGVSACTWEGRAEAMGYYNQTLAAAVAAGVTTTLDFTLDAGWPSLSDAAVSVGVLPDSTDEFVLTLGNEARATWPSTCPNCRGRHLSTSRGRALPLRRGTHRFIPTSPPRPTAQPHSSSMMAEQADLSAAFGIATARARTVRAGRTARHRGTHANQAARRAGRRGHPI